MTSPSGLPSSDAEASRLLSLRIQLTIVGTIAIGGAIGALARYAAGHVIPSRSGDLPWTTLAVNVAGCAAIGALMVAITEFWTVHELVQPFFGVGVLGGFTTFSTYAVDVQQLIDNDEAVVAITYFAMTPILALLAVWVAAAGTRRLLVSGQD